MIFIPDTESIYDPILSELSKRSFRDESSAYAEHSIMRFGRAPHSIMHFGKRQSIWPSRSESSTERNRLESTAFDLNESPHFVLVPIARSSSIYSLVSDDERAPELRRKKSPESRFGMNRGVFMHFGWFNSIKNDSNDSDRTLNLFEEKNNSLQISHSFTEVIEINSLNGDGIIQ